MKTEPRWLQYRWVIVIIPLIILSFIYRSQLLQALTPFFLAVIIASMIEPLITFSQNKLRLGRTPAALISLLLGVCVLAYIITLVLINGVNQIWTLASQLPKNQQYLVNEISTFFTNLRNLYPALSEESMKVLESILSNVFSSLQGIISVVINRILAFTASLPNVFIVLLITFLATYFIAKDKKTITYSIIKRVPPKWRKDFSFAAGRAIREIIGFIKGQIFLSFITLALSALFMAFFIKSPYWMLLSIVLALLDAIPVMGPGLILMPWAIVALFTGHINVTWILVILYVLIIILRQTLQPKILGNYTGIHPLLMLFSIYAGLILFGIWGLFIGPILVIMIRAFWGFLKNIQKQA